MPVGVKRVVNQRRTQRQMELDRQNRVRQQAARTALANALGYHTPYMERSKARVVLGMNVNAED